MKRLLIEAKEIMETFPERLSKFFFRIKLRNDKIF